MKIIPYTKHASLAEIGQSMALRFALLRKIEEGVFEQYTLMCRCKDFLVDCFSASDQKKDFSIYGFSWKGSVDVPDLTGTYLLLKFPDAAARQNFGNNLRHIHQIERQNNIPLTQIHDLEDNSAAVIADKRWISNSLYFSLYTFLLRVFCYELKTDDWIKEISSKSVSDADYVKHCPRETWDLILGDLHNMDMDCWNGLDYSNSGISGVHHNSGFVSVASNHTEISQSTVRKNKHWQEFQKRGIKTYTKP